MGFFLFLFFPYIINQMEETFDDIIDILVEVLGQPHSHNDYKGQISFDCPVCSHEIKSLDEGDGKGNLEVNYKQGVYKCWVCNETHNTHGNMVRLVRKYGSKKHYERFLLFLPEEFIPKEKEYTKIVLPKEFKPLSKVSGAFKNTPIYKTVMSYLKNRGVTDLMIQIHNIGFCFGGDFSHRIIVPSYDEYGDLNYFVGRSFLNDVKFKYKNPIVDKEKLIWNEPNIIWEEPVYIVEGVFDSIFVPNSIPMLGKYMTDNLFNKIYDNAKQVVIVLDPDAKQDLYKLYHRLNCGKLMGKVKVIELEGDKDIGDLRGDLSNYKEKFLE